MEFKIGREEYSEDVRTYKNNKSKLARSLIGQCALSVTEQLREVKDNSTGQYDVLWVLSALSQICTEAEKMEFKIDREEYSEDVRTYKNNKSKLG